MECHCVGDLIDNLATGRRQRGVRGRCHVRGRNSNQQLIDFKCTCNVGMKMDAKKAGQLRLPIKIGLFVVSRRVLAQSRVNQGSIKGPSTVTFTRIPTSTRAPRTSCPRHECSRYSPCSA